MKRHLGFTLIELLVVIVIIAILAAVLFPVFAQVREKARQSVCTSNTKQLGLAFLQYTQDYDEFWPVGDQVNGDDSGWYTSVYPYIKSADVYTCPSDITTGKGVISYAMNRNLSRVALGTINAPPASGGTVSGGGKFLTSVSLLTPTKTVLLYEITGMNSQFALNGDELNSVSTYGPTMSSGQYINPFKTSIAFATGWMGVPAENGANWYPPKLNSPIGGRHSGGANYSFCDGHVKWLMGSQVSPGQNNNNSDCGQNTLDSYGAKCAGLNAEQVNKNGFAAGTNYSKFAGTFSAR